MLNISSIIFLFLKFLNLNFLLINPKLKETIKKPNYSFGLEIWRLAKRSYILLQSLQSEILRRKTNVSDYESKTAIRNDHYEPFIKKLILSSFAKITASFILTCLIIIIHFSCLTLFVNPIRRPRRPSSDISLGEKFSC